jgi:hypothetical protein
LECIYAPISKQKKTNSLTWISVYGESYTSAYLKVIFPNHVTLQIAVFVECKQGRRKGCATCAAAKGAIERGGAKTGGVKKYILSQGQNVPPWASEEALFKHVAQGAKMPSYGPECKPWI